MQEKLIIILNAADVSRPSWAVVDDAGIVRQSALKDAPDGLAEIAANKQVIVLLPAEAIVLTDITMPILKPSKLLKAIPYALEDQLIDDVDKMHFAISEQQPDGKVAVAICTQQQMSQWLDLIKSWDIQPDVLLSAVYGVPYEENTCMVVIEEGQAIIRLSEYIGLGIDELNLSAILPENHKIISDYNIQSMTTAISDYKSINLLQGDFFQRKSKQFAIGNLWKVSAYLATGLIVLLFLNPIISTIILNNASKKINLQIADIYKRNFPNAKNIVAPKERMQDKLQKITGSLTQNHWLLLLAYLSDGVQKTKGIQIKKVDYQNSLMSVDVVADSSQHFENLMSDLASQGLTVKQQNASVTPTRVEALLTIE